MTRMACGGVSAPRTWIRLIAAGLAVTIAIAAGAAFLTVGGLRGGHAAPEPSKEASPAASPQAATAGSHDIIRVRTIRPTRERLQKLSTQAAYVEPYEQAGCCARVSGYLEIVHVDIGDQVRKGQVLAKLSVPEMVQEQLHKEALVEKAQAEATQAEAAVKAAEAMVDAASTRVDEARAQIARYEAEEAFRKLEYERHLRLFNERALQRDLVDEKLNQLQAAEAHKTAARSAVATAEANLVVEQARLRQAAADLKASTARVKVAETDLTYTTVMLGYAKIIAPYDGIITQRLFHPGAFIQSAADGKSDPLLHIARVDRMRIVAELPEADSSWVKIGQPAVLRVDALRGQQFTGKVARLAGALDASSRTMRVEVELDSPTTVLRPGMYGSLSITLADQADAIMLPANALLVGTSPSVMIVRGGRAERRAIEVGQSDGIRLQVLRGLTGEEEVIAEGKESVRDGQVVEVAAR